MTSHTRLRWLVALACCVGALAFATPARHAAASADKSFSLVSVHTTAVVQPDASMDVTEVVTYDFQGGPFEFGIRSFEDNLDQITDFAAADPLGQLTVIPPAQSISGDWEWELRSATSDTEVTYVVTYRVLGALEVGSDVADLNWRFIGTEHPGVDELSITVQFPPGIPAARTDTADDDTTVLRGFAHGPQGVIEVHESQIVATVDEVDAEQFVEIRAAVPATAFAVAGDEELLPGLLEEERDLLDERNDREDKHALGWILTLVLAGLGAIGTGVLWLVGGRERTSREVLGEYWREPLTDPPAVVTTTLSRGGVDDGAVIASTLVDLAQRGYLKIVGERVERLGPDKTVHHYHWLGKPLGDDVLPYERDLLEMVFRGATEVTSEDLTDWAKSNQKTARKLLDVVVGGVREEYDARGYEAPTNTTHLGLLFLLCALVGGASFALKLYSDNGFAWVGVGAAVGLFALGAGLLGNRTQAGVEATAKAAGLKRFLKDFSRLEDAPVGHLILWERYLVYAVALGVSAELMRGLAVRVPAVLADPNFGVWYVGTAGRFDGFDQIETEGASIASASTPNSSGSGGGFSGGSSGGGGGGGFGAR